MPATVEAGLSSADIHDYSPSRTSPSALLVSGAAYISYVCDSITHSYDFLTQHAGINVWVSPKAYLPFLLYPRTRPWRPISTTIGGIMCTVNLFTFKSEGLAERELGAV